MTSESSNSGSIQHDSPVAGLQAPVRLTYQHSSHAYNSRLATTSTQPYYSQPAVGSGTAGNPSYYSYASWQSGWPSVGGYAYPGNYQALQQGSFVPYQPQDVTSDVQTTALANISTRPKSPMSSHSPPPPESYRHWDEVIVLFLTRLGLTQAAAGFEADILVMNPVWEQKKVHDALTELSRNISALRKSAGREDDATELSERPLEERKLDYLHLENGAQPCSPSTINKSISSFLAQNRARNDTSNRAEFVYTPAEKKRQPNKDANSSVADIPSCARVDAKALDRDVQMKYDIAKNEEGPLSRTVKILEPSKAKGKQKAGGSDSRMHTKVGFGQSQDDLTSDRHPGLDERLSNIEKHLAIRYVPSPPRFLLDRLKFLENHIVRLEKEYPPWAALHFNQPNRGWPPPPRSTPIIVPAHMRLPTKDAPLQQAEPSATSEVQAGKFKFRKSRSSLHRAVIERLEVQQAMSDLAPGSGS